METYAMGYTQHETERLMFQARLLRPITERLLRGLTWAGFREVTVEEFAGGGSFDALVGRYVVVHQKDPAAFLAAAARNLRPGGVIAFHELDFTQAGPVSWPEVPEWEQTISRLKRAIAAVTTHADAGSRLRGHFADAGLPEPKVRKEFLTGSGPDSPQYRWATETARTLLPVLDRIGVPADQVGVETLEARLRAAVVQAGARVTIAPQYLATARTSDAG